MSAFGRLIACLFSLASSDKGFMKKDLPIILSVAAAILLIAIDAEANTGGDFAGGVAIGGSYAGVNTAPSNGLIVQGQVGIGTSSTTDMLDIAGAISLTTTASVPANGMY